MSALQPLANWVSITKYKAPPSGAVETETGPVNQNPFLTKQNLTFSGLSVAAAAIINFFARDAGTARLVAAALVAAAFGGFLIFLALIDANRETGPGVKPTIWFLGIVNTMLLFISIYGVASIDPPGDAGNADPDDTNATSSHLVAFHLD